MPTQPHTAIKMKHTELVFVPLPLMGHLPSTVEIAKRLTRRDPRISITVLLMKFPVGSPDGTVASADDSDSIRFAQLPDVQVPVSLGALPPIVFLTELVKAYVPLVRAAVRELTLFNSVQLAGFVLDMFCTPMIDVAHELGVPSYLFFASGAAYLGFISHLQLLHDDDGLDLDGFKDWDAELVVPSFANSVPGKVFPSPIFDKETGGAETVLYHTRRLREVKGIMANTCVELEPRAVGSFSGAALPPVYPVGPILHTRDEEDSRGITHWLDDQPESSVVFLCFGSMGSFGADQIMAIADGLEKSGHRFLWSLRKPSPLGPCDYEDVKQVLPPGFLPRTAAVGKVIGWAPQRAVLGHPAVGGFVSHCGWNSLLESIWHGVPVATWPLYGEQQINAYLMVKELGLGVEVRMDYDVDKGCMVDAREIEDGVRNLMKLNSEVRKKAKEMQKITREAMVDGGSSHFSLGQFIEDLMTFNASNQPIHSYSM